MRNIEKGRQPQSLIAYKKTKGAYFDGIPADLKDELRKSLLCEQGYLCAYCMRRIKDDRFSVKIEHFVTRKDEALSLEYKNFLLCCSGKVDGESDRSEMLCCDSSKGNKPLKFNPADPNNNIELYIRYKPSGEIYSKDEDFNRELNDTLNLNNMTFVNCRLSVIDGIFASIDRVSKGNYASREKIEKLLQRWIATDKDGLLKEYCGVAVFFLKKS